jgi:hypothetical protein
MLRPSVKAPVVVIVAKVPRIVRSDRLKAAPALRFASLDDASPPLPPSGRVRVIAPLPTAGSWRVRWLRLRVVGPLPSVTDDPAARRDMTVSDHTMISAQLDLG